MVSSTSTYIAANFETAATCAVVVETQSAELMLIHDFESVRNAELFKIVTEAQLVIRPFANEAGLGTFKWNRKVRFIGRCIMHVLFASVFLYWIAMSHDSRPERVSRTLTLQTHLPRCHS